MPNREIENFNVERTGETISPRKKGGERRELLTGRILSEERWRSRILKTNPTSLEGIEESHCCWVRWGMLTLAKASLKHAFSLPMKFVHELCFLMSFWSLFRYLILSSYTGRLYLCILEAFWSILSLPFFSSCACINPLHWFFLFAGLFVIFVLGLL